MVKVTLTRLEVEDIYKLLSAKGQELVGNSDWHYFVARVLHLLKEYIIEHDSLRKQDQIISAYTRAKEELVAQYANRDQEGKIRVIGSSIDISIKEFYDKVHKLDEDNRDALQLHINKLLALESLLKEKVVVDLPRIKWSKIPDSLNPAMRSIIWPIIEDDSSL